MRNILIAFMTLAWFAMMSVPGSAQSTAFTTADVNMREGPGTGYRVIVTIPAGSSVLLHDCAGGSRWCDVSWRRYRGFVYDRYLSGDTGAYVPRYREPRVVPPAIIFEYNDYDDRFYTPRYRYRDRYDRRYRIYRDRSERRKYKKRRDRRKLEKRRDRRKSERRRDRRKLEKRRDRRKSERRRDRRKLEKRRKQRKLDRRRRKNRDLNRRQEHYIDEVERHRRRTERGSR